MGPSVQHVFFDLDGTLLDTAPGLIGVLNTLRAEHGLDALGGAQIIPHISNGIDAILAAGFESSASRRERLCVRYEDLYRIDCCRGVRPFAGIDNLLGQIEGRGIGWSIITNKKESYSRRIVECLGLDGRISFLVGGDTLMRHKPCPDQLLHICRRLNIPARRTLMIGDSSNDVLAARACGAIGLLALWGYLPPAHIWRNWGADRHADAPESVPASVPELGFGS